MAVVVAVALVVVAALLLLHGHVLVALVLSLAAGWIVAGTVAEVRAPRCPSCGGKFCLMCAAVEAPVPDARRRSPDGGDSRRTR